MSFFSFNKAPSIDEDKIVQEWSQLVLQMGNRGEELLKSIAAKIQELNMPQGTKIPSGVGGGINVEFLKKMEEFYGDSLSPKDLDSLKKAREQLKDIIPQGTEIPSGKKIFDLEDIKNTQDEMQEEYKKLTPEELEWIKKAQEQGQFESITPPEIPGDSSGMGM